MPSSAPDVQAEVDVGERLRALRRSLESAERSTLQVMIEKRGRGALDHAELWFLGAVRREV